MILGISAAVKVTSKGVFVTTGVVTVTVSVAWAVAVGIVDDPFAGSKGVTSVMVAADTEDASIPQTMVTSGRQKLLANRIDGNLSIQSKGSK